MESSVRFSEDLLAEVEKAAQKEHRTITEVFSDAARRYLDNKQWQRLVAMGGRRAAELGITEEDVPRLIQDVRREDQEHRR